MKYVLKRYTTLGFTLMEVMMVIAIVGVLLMLVTPSVKSMIDKQRVRGTCESIYQTMALARSSSVALNKDVTFNFRSSNAGATWCVGLSDGAACDCSTAASACTVNSIKRAVGSTDFGSAASSSIKVTNIPNDTSVVFSARDAAPVTTPPDIYVRSNTWACGIHLELLGQVRLLKTGSGTSARAVVPLAEAAGLY